MNETIAWLLQSDEPWTRYRTLIDLLDQPENSPEVAAEQKLMLEHPQVQFLTDAVSEWPGYALKRHNDARHPIHKLSTLADFGLTSSDPLIERALHQVLANQSYEGAFKTPVFIPKAFGGTDQEQWTWMLCDAPTLLYNLAAMGLGEEQQVQRASHHLSSLVEDNGWHCTVSPDQGKFRGPGRRGDPCPIANVLALKALSQFPDLIDSKATRAGAETVLHHWELRQEKKYYLFGIGTDFLKLKYPFVWYDILHVVDVLSRFPFVHPDARFQEMVTELTSQSDTLGRYTASSMYMAWKGWSFADKKKPSPWLTFLILRVTKSIAAPV